MNLGLDFYGTISADPKAYSFLARTFLDTGYEVHVVTAIAPQNEKQVYKDIRKSRVPYTQVHVLTYTEWHQVPSLKTNLALELNLQMFVDDRADVVARMRTRGILAFLA